MGSLISLVSVDTSFPFGYGYIMQTDTEGLRFVVEINYENRVYYKHGENINHKSKIFPTGTFSTHTPFSQPRPEIMHTPRIISPEINEYA